MIKSSRSRMDVFFGGLDQTDRRKLSISAVKIHYGVLVNCNKCIGFEKDNFSVSDRGILEKLREFSSRYPFLRPRSTINPGPRFFLIFLRISSGEKSRKTSGTRVDQPQLAICCQFILICLCRGKRLLHSLCDFMLLLSIVKLYDPLPPIWLID